MPSNKDKVASYLETDEVQALDRFCKEKECSRSQGVAYLIQEKLINDQQVSPLEISINELKVGNRVRGKNNW